MSKTVWKFDVPIEDEFSIYLPLDKRLLDVQVQRGKPYVWALVDPESGNKEVRFRLLGTGHPTGDSVAGMHYVGTFQLNDGKLVYHLWSDARTARDA